MPHNADKGTHSSEFPKEAQASAPSRLPSLDGWRALCIVLVLGSHSENSANFPTRYTALWRWIFDGVLGVRIFFIISGFLITWLMLKEFDRTERVSLPRFYARRALRILPVYAAFLCTLGVLQIFTPYHQALRAWIGALTFTSNYVPGPNWTVGHLWSLGVEEQFYFLWPSLFVLFGCGSHLRRSLYVLAVPLLLAPVARVLSYLNCAPYGIPLLFVPNSFLNFFDSLAIGCICAFVLARRTEAVRRLSSTRPRLLQFVAVAMILVPHILVRLFAFGVFTVPLGNTFQGIGLAVLILQSVVMPKSGLYQVLNLPVISQIGVLSYSIYIWHMIFCTSPDAFGLGNVGWMSFPYWMMCSVAVAAVSYYVLERPLLQLRTRFRA
jgi:peptidoglycan/LPS O-acetylase OafA/YrhL